MNPNNESKEKKELNGNKKDLVKTNEKIAKENEISVKKRSNKDIGKSTLTYLMRDLSEKDFDRAEADYYDQLTGKGTYWAVELSNKAILQDVFFDENDKKDVYETNYKLVQDLYKKLDEEREKNRLLNVKVDELNSIVATMKMEVEEDEEE